MYVVAGVTGNTGGAVARHLLAHKLPVTVIVRQADKGKPWEALGAKVAVADLTDTYALGDALKGAEAVYVLNPPAYQATDPFADAERVLNAFVKAIKAAGVQRIVGLSSIGAQHASGTGLIVTNYILEQKLRELGLPVTFIRAASFMENLANAAGLAKLQGILPSFQPDLSYKIPMVATEDIGRVAAEELQKAKSGTHIIDLEGPAHYSPNDAAEVYTKAFGRPVKAISVPQEQWESTVRSWGMSEKSMNAYIEMVTAGGLGKLVPEGGAATHQKGTVTLQECLTEIAKRV